MDKLCFLDTLFNIVYIRVDFIFFILVAFLILGSWVHLGFKYIQWQDKSDLFLGIGASFTSQM